MPDKAALGVLHSQIMAQELRSLNSKFVSALRNNLFGVKPKNGRHSDRLQLLYPLLYGTHIDALLQDNEEELDCYLWFDKPWRMPAVKAWAAIPRLATSSEGIGTGMFLADLKALIDASAAPDGITAHELDARAEGVLKVCDQFTSVRDLKDFIRSCLRAETIKSVASRGDKIGYAHGQANNWLITKRLEGGGLSLKDTQYALDLAARFMAEETKPTPTPAKTYLTVAADPELDIDEKKEHVAMLLSFYETHKDNDDRGRKSGRGDGALGRGPGRGGGRGRTGGADGGAPRKQTPGLPTSRGNDAAASGDKKKFRCTHDGCPSPKTHDTSVCEHHAQYVLDRKRKREMAACAAAFFSALSSNKSGDGSASSYYSCLSDTDSTDSACLSATPAPTDTSAPPPSSSFWSCFVPATATCFVTIDCDKKKSAVLDSGASVDITSDRHRTGQLTDSPEMVQGISGTTHAWPTRVQWHTKTDCGVLHLLHTQAGFEEFKQLYMPNAPDQILSLSQLVEAGYLPHFRPSAQKSWLTTPCKKRITVVLVDGVWRMPL